MAMNGTLTGLVAVTAGCGTVNYWAAFVIGLVAGVVYLGGSKLLIYLRIDDAVDAIPVHLFGGVWGLLATGLFSTKPHMEAAFGFGDHVGLFYEITSGSFDAVLLLNQVIAIFFIFGWSVATMGPFFVWLNYMGWFRADSLEEIVGLDLSYHGGVHAGDFEEVTPAQLKAFKDKKGNLRRRRVGGGARDEIDDVDDGASWTDMTFASNNGTPTSSQAPEAAPKRAQHDDIESVDYSRYDTGSTYSLGEDSEITRRS